MILTSAAILIALAASGETSTSSQRSDEPAQSESGNVNTENNKPSGPHDTVSQQNAIEAAQNYLKISGFSRAGLIEQLSSSAGDGYPYGDAVFAVDRLHVNWDEQAVKSAKSYLNTSSFSCQGMIEQLSSSAGDKYTVAQAEYAARKVGLC